MNTTFIIFCLSIIFPVSVMILSYHYWARSVDRNKGKVGNSGHITAISFFICCILPSTFSWLAWGIWGLFLIIVSL